MPMLSSLSLVFRHAPIRVSAIAIFFFGFTGAATSPYMSLIGIKELGLSDALYSVLSFAAAVVNVSAAVTAGIVADRLGHFRSPMILAALFGIVGFGLVYLVPTQLMFCVAALVFIPIFGAINSLIFANVKAVSVGMPVRELIAVNSAIRAVLSASWVLVPGIVGALLAGGPSMLPAFLLASLAGCVCLLLFIFGIDRNPPPQEEGRVHSSFFRSVLQIGSGSVLTRLLAVALISAMLHMNGTVLPLILTGKAGGTPADVGVIVGIVAFLEIIFILFWGWVEARTSTVLTMSIAATIYCAYLVFLGLADDPMDVYILTLISGLGAAGIIAIPITYLQNLISDRAGLGSSLIAVNIFVSGGLSSLMFALGTAISDYAGTAILSAVAGLAGVVLLWILDKPGRRQVVLQGGE
jgi:MFS transporter, SET family, sugar efflux transporter